MHKRKDGYKKGVEDVKEDGQGVALLKEGRHKTSELTGRLAAQCVPAGAVSVVPVGRQQPACRLCGIHLRAPPVVPGNQGLARSGSIKT